MKCDVCGKKMEICEECVEMYRGMMGEWMRKECWL